MSSLRPTCQAKLKALQAALAVTQAAGVTAANTISGQFAQAFRIAENASMDALAKMNAELAPLRLRPAPDRHALWWRSEQDHAAWGNAVWRHKIKRRHAPGQLPDERQWQRRRRPVLWRARSEHEGHGRLYAETADNVSKLDANSKHYFDGLSSDIGGYSRQQMAQQTVAISKLSEVAAWMKLDSYSLAALVHNNDSGATGTGKTMFGDAFDSQYGSYISAGASAHQAADGQFPGDDIERRHL
jgi:hypothetical protein